MRNYNNCHFQHFFETGHEIEISFKCESKESGLKVRLLILLLEARRKPSRGATSLDNASLQFCQ